jgi:predicted secreted protein
MTWWAALAVYFVIWWTLLFCVLPLNIESQAERGERLLGTDPGAPVTPNLGRKAIITSILSLAVFVVVYAVWVWAEM